MRVRRSADFLSLATLLLLPFFLSGFIEVVYSLDKAFFSPFQLWSDQFVQFGFVRGYYASNDIYPPLTYTIIAAATKLAHVFDTSVHFWYKMVQIAFLCSCIYAMAFWGYSKFAIFAFLSCMLVNSILFESADIFYTLPLLVAIDAFLKHRYTLFASMLMLATLIKWQPLIAAPALGMHFLLSAEFANARERSKVIFQRCALPALIVLLLFVVIFGPQFLFKFFDAATASVVFSGNTYNLNYALGWLYGAGSGLVDLTQPLSPARILTLNLPPFLWRKNLPDALWWFSKISFCVGACLVFIGYLRQPKNRENAIYFAFLFVFSYSMLATEVHTNHIHLGVVLLAPLFDRSERYSRLMLYIGVAFSTNLILYLSPWRDGFYFVSFSFLMSLLNMVVLGYVLFDALFGMKPRPSADPFVDHSSEGRSPAEIGGR